MKKMRSCLIAVICVIAALIGSSPLMSEEKQQAIDEALFVEEFLKMKFAKTVSKKIPLVIEQDLSLAPLYDIKKDHVFDELLQQAEQEKDDDGNENTRLIEAVKDFCEKNSRTNTFESLGTVNIPHIVLSEKEMEQLFSTEKKDGWKEFYKKYPKSPGIITLSRIGFSKDGTLAVIYMGNQQGWLAGGGRIYTFDKKDGKWLEVIMLMGPCWMS